MSLFVDIEKKLGVFTLTAAFETGGGILGILGASGCGKSMTLKCVAGIEKPDRGKIVLDGVTLFDSQRRVNLPTRKRGVGYLFQNYSLFPNMTVSQNILCGMHSEKSKDKKARVLAELLELTGLEGLENRRPDLLSGGQRQRAALARILASNPDLLMLDEPFSALDNDLRSHLQIETQRLLRRFGKDVLLVTHSRDEAYRLCGKIALMDDGKLFEPRDTKELFANPESRRAALLTGCKNIADAKKISEYEAEVPAWGVRLTLSQPVRDDLCAIAIRPRCFDHESPQNRFPVRFTGEMEEPLDRTLQFRYERQHEKSPDIWRRVPKEKDSGHMPLELGVDSVNVLPLYE